MVKAKIIPKQEEFTLVGYKGNDDRIHHACPSDQKKRLEIYLKKLGYKVVVYTTKDYWDAFYDGKFSIKNK